VGERNFVFSSNLVPYDDLVDVVELVPVFIVLKLIAIERLKLGAAWDSQVQSLGCVERLLIKQIEVVFIRQIREQLVCQTVEVGHDWQG